MKSFGRATRSAFDAGFLCGNGFDRGCQPEDFGDTDYQSWRTEWADPPEPDRGPIHWEGDRAPTHATHGLRIGDTWNRAGVRMVWRGTWVRAKFPIPSNPEESAWESKWE